MFLFNPYFIKYRICNFVFMNQEFSFQEIIESKEIIFYDGVCNLCNGSVNYILKRDKKKLFLFTSLQSEFSKEFLECHKELKEIDSIFLSKKNQVFTKSSAIIEIFASFSTFSKVFYIGYLIPKLIRDYLYENIAKRRYKWFGKTDNCSIPTPETKVRFLD